PEIVQASLCKLHNSGAKLCKTICTTSQGRGITNPWRPLSQEKLLVRPAQGARDAHRARIRADTSREPQSESRNQRCGEDVVSRGAPSQPGGTTFTRRRSDGRASSVSASQKTRGD